MLKIYNTLTRKKEIFKPYKQDDVKIYYCGPTPYNYAHIWNLKTYVWNDMIVRTLNFLWYKTTTTMNITDIDDKTIRDSQVAKKTLLEHTQFYTKAFMEDIEKLKIKKADNIAPISTIIPEMVRMINTLLRRWNAYLADDWSIYYSIKTFKKYWELAHLDIKWLISSVRINNDEYEKEDVWDFALWKAWDEKDWENFWEESFVIPKKMKIYKNEKDSWIDPHVKHKDDNIITIKWRPGWHIECSACAMKYLWPKIDLHMWWIDNLFPHHQNEVAQTEACTKEIFSKYWAHHWHLMVNWAKMSKSKNNFYTLRDLEEKFKDIPKNLLYRAIRLNFLNGIYRDSVDLSFPKLETNFNTLKWIDETLKNIKNYKTDLVWVKKEFSEKMQEIIKDYIEKLEDDFNIPEALAVFFSFQKFVNSGLRKWDFSNDEIKSIIDMYKTFDEVLAIIDFSFLEDDDKIPESILKLFEQRNKAKKEKDFELADTLRDEISNLWYKIIDDRWWSRVEKI